MKSNTLYTMGLCAVLSLGLPISAQTTIQTISIEIKEVGRPELKGTILSYEHRLLDVDSLAKGIYIGYRYETAAGCIISHPHKEANPPTYYQLEDGSNKKLPVNQGWHTFLYPNANNKHVCDSVLNITRNKFGAPIYIDGEMRAKVSRGIAKSKLIALEDEMGTFQLGEQEVSYKKLIYRGDPTVEIIMDKSDVLEQFYFHDSAGKEIKPSMSSMLGMRQYVYKYGFKNEYPAALSFSYKEVPIDATYPIKATLYGHCEVLDGSASGDIRAEVAEFQLKLKPETLDIASGKLRLLVRAPEGVRIELPAAQELSLSTEAGEALPSLKLMPKNVCYDRNNKQMYIMCDLPNIKGNKNIVIKGELKLKSDGNVAVSSSQPLNTKEGGEVIINGTNIHYKSLPAEGNSPWTYLVLTSPDKPISVTESGFAPVFLDAEGKTLASSPQLLNAKQSEQLGISADEPVKAYRFRKTMPAAIQAIGKQSGELSIPVALKLSLGASPDVSVPLQELIR